MFILGGLILGWCLYELFHGTTWTYRKILRKFEPATFWAVWSFWVLVSLPMIVPALLGSH